MQYHAHIEINDGRINYELREFGSAIIGVPSSASEDEISTALKVLRSKYDFVDLDVDGDIVVSA